MLEAAEHTLAASDQGTTHSDRFVRCEHLCETTTRYDHGQKQLSFLLVCGLCGTEELVERIRFEPRFTKTP